MFPVDAAAEGVSEMSCRLLHPWISAKADIHQEKRNSQDAA
jgi:hypothetical protein